MVRVMMTSAGLGWQPDTETREHWARAGGTREASHSRGSIGTRRGLCLICNCSIQ